LPVRSVVAQFFLLGYYGTSQPKQWVSDFYGTLGIYPYCPAGDYLLPSFDVFLKPERQAVDLRFCRELDSVAFRCWFDYLRKVSSLSEWAVFHVWS
jgi:hypothetical protein